MNRGWEPKKFWKLVQNNIVAQSIRLSLQYNLPLFLFKPVLHNVGYNMTAAALSINCQVELCARPQLAYFDEIWYQPEIKTI